MQINLFFRSAGGAAELSRLAPALRELEARGHQIGIYSDVAETGLDVRGIEVTGIDQNATPRGDVHLALGWDAVSAAAGAPILQLIPVWEGLGAEGETLERIDRVYRDPELFRGVFDEFLANFLEKKFGMKPIVLPRGEIENEATGLEEACGDILRAGTVKRRYKGALDLAWDAKVAEIGPASPWGAVMLAGPARQLTVACTGDGADAEALATVPKIRIGRGGKGPWGLEVGAYDLVVHLNEPGRVDHSTEIAEAASLLVVGGSLVYGSNHQEAAAAARCLFNSVECDREGTMVCKGAGQAAQAGKDDPLMKKMENPMLRNSGWDFAPPIEMEPDLQVGSVRQAERDLGQLIQALGASLGKVHLTAAQALICSGEYPTALRHAEASVAFGTREEESLNTLGWLRYLEKDDQGALAAFDEALSRSPDHPDVLYNKGMVLFSLGRREEAADLWEHSIRAGNALQEVFNNLGVIRFGEGRTQEAAALFGKALAIDPGYGEAHENLACCAPDPAQNQQR